jgi:hypothetical protein
MRLAVPVGIAGGCFAAVLTATGAVAQDIKIGAGYDLTGPFAGDGSKPADIGNKIAIDMVNEKGGVEGHKIGAIDADAQSKVDVAINEAERLLNEAEVDLLMGVYSSAQCVPFAAKVDGQNERSIPVVMQYADGHTKIAWPTAIRTVDPVLPLPKGHAYAR